MSYVHKDDCLAARSKQDLLRAKYSDRWPKHCRECDGRGGFTSYYDPSPAGVSLGPGWMTEWEPCQACTNQGICPRCGKVVWDDMTDEFTCPKCGWNELSVDTHAPYPWECICSDD